ncbi:hypothetical protein EIP91_005250 [Steccherinum ochraceum]|uniref:Uncharacterized protein n=1 Tax=Steccherinum ochraceum TaxID=92696 RepID=A0A4R0RMK4_9APHY|nr:hypothetical protein EIP91_005250 [Steccherinum ochraceum]
MPTIPTPYTLETAPAKILETLCVSACKLHNNWTSRMPSPTRLSAIIPQFKNPPNFTPNIVEPVGSTHLSPGGRFLLMLTADHGLHVCDLNTLQTYLAVSGTELMQCQQDVKTDHPDYLFKGFPFFAVKVRIAWLSDTTASMSLLLSQNLPSGRMCIHQDWTIELARPICQGDTLANEGLESSSKDSFGSSDADEALSVKAACQLPRLTRFELPAKMLDTSVAGMTSFYALRTRSIEVRDIETGRGISLVSGHTEQFVRTQAETRLLKFDTRIYVGCVDRSTTLHIYLVPPLEDPDGSNFREFHATPVAMTTLAESHARYLGDWQSSTSERDVFRWRILTPHKLSIITFFAQSQLMEKTELDLLSLSDHLNHLHLHLPSPAEHWLEMGTVLSQRGIMVSVAGQRQELRLVASSSLDGVGNEDTDTALDEFTPGSRKVLAGLGTKTYIRTSVPPAAVAFDEHSGRMVFLKCRYQTETRDPAQPEFLLVDFAPKELLALY